LALKNPLVNNKVGSNKVGVLKMKLTG